MAVTCGTLPSSVKFAPGRIIGYLSVCRGVFPRPANISKEFGGGRTLKPGEVRLAQQSAHCRFHASWNCKKMHCMPRMLSHLHSLGGWTAPGQA